MSESTRSVSDYHRLDKTLFAAGIQCAKRLYREYHDPGSIPAHGASRKTLVEIGDKLREMAWEGFPRGERVEEADHAAAVAHTRELIEQDSGAAIFDAAFELNGVEVRCDVVLPSRDAKTVDIFEVKSGCKVKPRHVMDVALQMWVIEGRGYTVRSASLLHLDAEYRHGGGKTFPVHTLFKNADVTKKARRRKRRVPDYLDNFQNILEDETTLELPTGTWCIQPIPCCFLPDCRKQSPSLPLLEFPDLTPAQESSLHQGGIETIDQIDAETAGLTPTQKRVLRSLDEDRLLVEPIVKEEFETIVFPLCFVSTVLSLQVLPRYEGSRPWQHVPFQWSAHVLHEDGTVEHRAHVASGAEDPRPGFVSALARCIDDVGTVMTWSKRLEPTLRQIMEDMPALKDEVRCLLQMDPIALDALVKDGIYHPSLHGAFDLETVRAALTTGEDADTAPGELAIRDEEAAQPAVEKLLSTRTRSTTRERLSKDLAAYAESQSQAMLAIYRVMSKSDDQALPQTGEADQVR